MPAFHEVFANEHVILPVIHAESETQAIRNARVAQEAGCDGVFLINHAISSEQLFGIFSSVHAELPDLWIGLNCLDLRPVEVVRAVPPEAAGIWVDNAGIDERTERQAEAEKVLSVRRQFAWRGLYFGGVAFKYQRQVEQLAKAAQTAKRYMDVVTTSGPGTGQAAHREKIATMKAAIGGFPLAIASGITPENVGDYLDVADCFLVATGVSDTFTELNAARVHQLVQVVRSFPTDEGARSRGRPGIRSVCFICEWNEGRSAHLEFSVRKKLHDMGSDIAVSSAGFSQGGRISPLRRRFLAERGISERETSAHVSAPFSAQHADTKLILVSELPMKTRLLAMYPNLADHVMSVRGFLAGMMPTDESISTTDAHIEDAAGHTDEEKLALYEELEVIATQVAIRLLSMNAREQE